MKTATCAAFADPDVMMYLELTGTKATYSLAGGSCLLSRCDEHSHFLLTILHIYIYTRKKLYKIIEHPISFPDRIWNFLGQTLNLLGKIRHFHGENMVNGR